MYLVSWRMLNREKITNKMVGMMRTPATRQTTGEIKNIFMFVPDGVRDHSSSKKNKVVTFKFEELLNSLSLRRYKVPFALLTEAQPGKSISLGFWDDCLTWRKQNLLCRVLKRQMKQRMQKAYGNKVISVANSTSSPQGQKVQTCKWILWCQKMVLPKKEILFSFCKI